MRYALVDTILSDYPMGVILLDEWRQDDGEGNQTVRWATVDGQQRCTTIFEYLEGNASWTIATPPAEVRFVRFENLTQARQDGVLDYLVPVAKLRGYEESRIRDIFIRIQYGRALQIGEKIKALNSPYRPYVEELAGHRIFSEWGGPHQYRDTHWAIAAAFLKAVYRQRPLERQEYRQLERFLRDSARFDERRVRRAKDTTIWLLNYCARLLDEAVESDESFRRQIRNQRLFKWLIPSIMILRATFSLQGREPGVAAGLLEYWRAKETEGSDEYEAYFRTLRSGRIDTDEVKACLEQLMNRVIAVAELRPQDPQRFFTPGQRREILERAGGRCEGVVDGRRCNAVLSFTNFHADHKVPHSSGGLTEVTNGQALCSGCNRRKGSRSSLQEVLHTAGPLGDDED